MTPFLILAGGMSPILAVGTDLVYGSVTKIVGAATHWRQNTVDLRVAAQMAMGSVPCGLFGVFILDQIRKSGFDPNPTVKHGLGIMLVLLAILLLARALGVGFFSERFHAYILKHWKPGSVLWGGIVGFAVGITSVGSGSLVAPFLLMMFPKQPARAVGTDVFHAAILVSATALLHTGMGNVEWSLVPALLAGSLPGVLIGSLLAPRLPERSLKVGLGVLLLITGIKMV